MKAENSNMLCLGEKIKMSRRLMGLTQEELAEKIGVTRTCIARYETGEIEPQTGRLIPLAEALNVSIDYLLGAEKSDSQIGWKLSKEAECALEQFIYEILKSVK